MTNQGKQTEKLTILAIMIALDVALSPLFRVEGMAPMSSVINVIGATMLGPVYVTIMATMCGIIRMLILGIPPLALTGAIFGALLAGICYKITGKLWAACLGEIFGTGIIGSLLSFPVMVWFTGSANNLYWFVYTPRFIGAALIGSTVAAIIMLKLGKIKQFQKVQKLFF
ncbi:energy coupling factor transporter S component ThiW [Lactobacillus sp. ESL0684]|uniref:energy coupling factor transporter S component ThiW n=1 Tax=unclassified Lactobacillus TaxID=2620435 RepID=UPI0023F97CB9|nr:MULTISPECIES: energy coupling factor transporter S component ThiW [unclassified Lactobacillus]WEV39651.1 energy coupling factor transporter S component ThiW [Lactobacillus sp. ESL0681]WEV43818.1 energy coupling factor transporter S component ThiW [Lactobacillus sp. ESL0684]